MKVNGKKKGKKSSKPLNKISLRTKVYESIKYSVLSGELRQGERIFAKDISEKFNFSLTPVREALLFLCNEKLLNSDKRSGFTVNRFTKADLEEYFFFRELLEESSTHLIIENIAEDEIKELEVMIDKAEYAYKNNNLSEFTHLHFDFHHALWASTGSNIYVDLISSMNHIFMQVIVLGARTPESVATAIKEHKEFVEAIRKKRSVELTRLTVKHVQSGKRNIMPLYSFL